MAGFKNRVTALCFIISILIFISPTLLIAGGEFRGKIQNRIGAQRMNVQYEPYYLSDQQEQVDL